MAVDFDQEVAKHLNAGIERLARSFAGIHSRDTVERNMYAILERWPNPRVTVHLPVLAERFARKRLQEMSPA